MSTPTTFEAHGKEWFPHTPGDPRPCDKDTLVFILTADGEESDAPESASSWIWDKLSNWEDARIKGWRYATPPQEMDEQPKESFEQALAMIGTYKAAWEESKADSARLREENASMRTAIKEGHTALEKVYLAHCSTTADVEGCGIDNIARDALATISPFTQPQ